VIEEDAMDIEFHYYAIGLLAKRAGFPAQEANIIATCSQYVDDNDVCLTVEDRDSPGSREYRNFISQTMNILKPKHELLRIYPLFHFIPGEPFADSALRRDGKMHLLNTTPNSTYAKTMLEMAFQAPEAARPYRIGVAIHGFADTWAHQNFVGWFDSFNSVDFDIKPAICHAEAEYHPDWAGHIWEDPRLLKPGINNTNRFLSAARVIFERFCSTQAQSGNSDLSKGWDSLQQELSSIFGRPTTGNTNTNAERRLEKWRAKMREEGLSEEYAGGKWFDQAVETEIRGLKDTHDGVLSSLTIFEDRYFWKQGVAKETTHWYRFQEAVKAHERAGLPLLQERFAQMGVDLARA